MVALALNIDSKLLAESKTQSAAIHFKFYVNKLQTVEDDRAALLLVVIQKLQRKRGESFVSLVILTNTRTVAALRSTCRDSTFLFFIFYFSFLVS